MLSSPVQVDNSIRQEFGTTAKVEDKPVARTDGPESTAKTTADKPPKFYAKNWDKIVNEFEEEEKSAGSQSIDELLKDIYSKGSDETKRAISKSFQESNGTVLSTNWNEVSQSKVDVKPPDGCEFKSWES